MLEPPERGRTLHDVVVRGQQHIGLQRDEPADGVLVSGQVVIARRGQPFAGAVLDAVVQNGIDDYRRAAACVPNAEVAEGVTGKVHYLDAPVRPQPNGFTAAQPNVDGGVATELLTDP